MAIATLALQSLAYVILAENVWLKQVGLNTFRLTEIGSIHLSGIMQKIGLLLPLSCHSSLFTEALLSHHSTVKQHNSFSRDLISQIDEFAL